MKYQKAILITLIAAGHFWLTACASVNSAQSQKEPETNKPVNIEENSKTSSKLPTFDPENAAPPKEAKLKSEIKLRKKDNSVCPEPFLPCHHGQKQFDEWELSFRMPTRIEPNTVYRSAPFYAVILKKYDEGCDEFDVNPAVEGERRRIQKLFPSRKVFAEYSCPNMSAAGYLFDGKTDEKAERVLYADYIAVYAGVREEEAREFFELIRKDYLQAELKKMTAAYSQIEQ